MKIIKSRVPYKDGCLSEKMRDIGCASYGLMEDTSLFSDFDLRWIMYFDDDNILGIRYDEMIDEDGTDETAIADILNFELESIGSDISLSEEDIPNPLSDIDVFALFETIFLTPQLLGVKELEVEYNY